MYFTDRGIEELEDRRGEDQVSVAWLAGRLRDFVDLNPGFDVAVDRLASWLARLDDEDLPTRLGPDAVAGAGNPACSVLIGRSRRRPTASPWPQPPIRDTS
jgi:Family of unknown function (DUF6104)